MTDSTRIYCEKYRAHINRATCLARIHQSDENWTNTDPICSTCSEYKQVKSTQAELKTLRLDLIETAGILLNLAERIRKLTDPDPTH